MKDYKINTLFILFSSLFLLGIASFVSEGISYRISERAQELVAGTFFTKSVDYDDLRDRYEAVSEKDYSELRSRRRKGLSNEPIKVLIVPGHDNENQGAKYKDTVEAELTQQLAKDLFYLFKDEEAFSVKLSRDEDGYDEKLLKYFERQESEIRDFKNKYQQEMNKLVQEGKVDLVNGLFHNSAPSDVAMRLYGINKWVNENEYDIVLHIHFNDYSGRQIDSIGEYNGFSIYVPEKQFSNAEASREFSEFIFDQLSTVIDKSNLPGEKDGIIEDQELIAIGAYNTVDAISILVEYGYIYEYIFNEPEMRDDVLEELAFQTFTGIKNFFNEEDISNESTLKKGTSAYKFLKSK